MSGAFTEGLGSFYFDIAGVNNTDNINSIASGLGGHAAFHG